MQAAIQERLERFTDLPSPPAIALRVLDLCQSDDFDLGQIAKTVSNDPALSAKMLRMANSPVFALRQEVRTVSHAVAILGVNAVRTLALSFSLVRDMKRGRQASLKAYWKRSLLAATAARELATVRQFTSGVEESFLGGLLQDIGALALSRLEPDKYEAITTAAGDDHARLAAAEIEAFGADHAEVGAWLLRKWRLPEPLCIALALSHGGGALPASMEGDGAELARLVAMSGPVADIWLSADAAAATSALMQSEAVRKLDLGPAKLENALARIAIAIPVASSLYDIDLGSADEIGSVLDRAKETLVMATLRTSRQMQTVESALGSLQAKTRELEEASSKDNLTGVANRGRFDAYLAQAFAEAQSTHRPLSVIMVDVDHFKKVNDTHGHPAGDSVLKGVAAIVSGRLRPRDLAARYGGEEFALILPETDAAGSVVVAERIRAKLEATPQPIDGGRTLKVTASLGCATFNPIQFSNAGELVKAADQALYSAKRGGRNRAIAWTPSYL